MCSVPGFDASGRVDDLAAELGRGMTSIAIGSEEGFAQADKAINTAAKSGRWVLLKNVHLAPSWLVTLEKKLHSLQAHASFRYQIQLVYVNVVLHLQSKLCDTPGPLILITHLIIFLIHTQEKLSH